MDSRLPRKNFKLGKSHLMNETQASRLSDPGISILACRHANPGIKLRILSLERLYLSSHSCYTPASSSQTLLPSSAAGQVGFFICVIPKAGTSFPAFGRKRDERLVFLASKQRPLNRLQIMQSLSEN